MRMASAPASFCSVGPTSPNARPWGRARRPAPRSFPHLPPPRSPPAKPCPPVDDGDAREVERRRAVQVFEDQRCEVGADLDRPGGALHGREHRTPDERDLLEVRAVLAGRLQTEGPGAVFQETGGPAVPLGAGLTAHHRVVGERVQHRFEAIHLHRGSGRDGRRRRRRRGGRAGCNDGHRTGHEPKLHQTHRHPHLFRRRRSRTHDAGPERRGIQ
jgi:hypothetical protein